MDSVAHFVAPPGESQHLEFDMTKLSSDARSSIINIIGELNAPIVKLVLHKPYDRLLKGPDIEQELKWLSKVAHHRIPTGIKKLLVSIEKTS